MNNRVIYYEDELNEEFSNKKITPIKIDENYKYEHGILWNACSFLIQNVLSMPLKIIHLKRKFKIKYIGKEKIKPFKNTGYFVYANHTQAFEDTFIPSVGIYPKRNFLIVAPENVSMKGLKTLTELFGAIPIANTKTAMKSFLGTIEKRIRKKSAITIYPEAHIWPYYTKIRPFKDVSFKYPIELNVPTFSITNTYQKVGKNEDKIRIVSYIDGPFYSNKELNKKDQQRELRNQVYNKMCERSKNSNIEFIIYKKKEK